MNPVATIADAAPSRADCDPLAGLDAEGRHEFGLGVLRMAGALTAARRRIAELVAENTALRADRQDGLRRIANQRAQIRQMHAAQDAARRDPRVKRLLERIDRDTAEADTAGACAVAPQVPVDDEDEDASHVCGPHCRGFDPAAAKPAPGGRWRDRLLPLSRRRPR